MPRRTEVCLVYATGLVQGLALFTFPAASSIFTGPKGCGFSASRYGLMFVPQMILAILGSSPPDLETQEKYGIENRRLRVDWEYVH